MDEVEDVCLRKFVGSDDVSSINNMLHTIDTNSRVRSMFNVYRDAFKDGWFAAAKKFTNDYSH